MHLLAIGLVAVCLQGPDAKVDDLHPAFKKTPDVLQKAWDKGEADAPKLRDPLGQMNKFRRGIGKIRTAPLREETVSWVWLMPAETLNYFCGFDARKKYRAEDETAKLKEQLIPKTDVYQTSIELFGTISLYPSWGGRYGSISRYANPRDLKDVRIVLQVGDRIYQPVEQPGDLLAEHGTGASTFAMPHYDYSTARTTVNGSAYGSGGYAYGSATANTTIVRQYETLHEQGYDWYRGTFSAIFKLFDKDGNPILKKTDKEFTVIVVYGTNERKATFKLEDLEHPL